jgi:hypothetical protein
MSAAPQLQMAPQQQGVLPQVVPPQVPLQVPQQLNSVGQPVHSQDSNLSTGQSH